VYWWLRCQKRVVKDRTRGFDSLIILVTWQIWLQQNARVFNSGSSPVSSCGAGYLVRVCSLGSCKVDCWVAISWQVIMLSFQTGSGVASSVELYLFSLLLS
jgi:hypothetical protein